MEAIVRFIWGLVKTMIVIVFILCVIGLIIVLSIPYAFYRLLGGRPFSTSRFKFNMRHQSGRPEAAHKQESQETSQPPRFKTNYDPDVIDVKATVVERHEL